MLKSIIKALFERHVPLSSERMEIERKITSEKNYYKGKMSPDDWLRFEGLENLYTQASSNEDAENFARGFIMGALIMFEVAVGREELFNE